MVITIIMKHPEICASKFNYMQTLHQTYHPSYTQSLKRPSVLSQFFSWCRNQEPHRYGWLAAIIALHGCVFSPITVLMIALGGNNIILWGMAIGAMGMSLITNLAALPTRITLPVFFFSIMIDLAIIAICLNTIFSN
jgi:hypothetical protein